MTNLTIVKTPILALALCSLLLSCSESNTPSPPASAKLSLDEAAPAAADPVENERKVCASELATRQAEYDRLMKANQYWSASLQLRNCADVLGDSVLKNKVAEAEIKTHQSVLSNPKSTSREKFEAAEMLVRDYPDRAPKVAAQLSTLQAKADADDKRRIASERRKRGVTLGMSPKEVIASSWGKPDSINRTTTVHGTREQWVYGSGSYLYFDDGVLTAIQN